EHVWTSPVNAVLICREIANALCEVDPENSGQYSRSCDEYCAKLKELDAQFRSIVENASCSTVVFADRFPVRYFVEEYGLEYFAAFPGCAEDTEPSARTVAYLIDRVREYKTPAVFFIEFSNEKMADIICEDTGCAKLLFHSCHNVSAQAFEDGVSYLELMKGNALNLKEALG
ncbi:MAG: metal ABC transporter substrate-binding protein, partial [Eubacteriales bacterium]|nr:metal ABC transporter substrate-binding protein [Eubacteriales bacterium]